MARERGEGVSLVNSRVSRGVMLGSGENNEA